SENSRRISSTLIQTRCKMTSVKRVFSVKSFAVAIALAISGFYFADARILGPESKLDPLFRELVEPLNLQGIDVVAGDLGVVPLDGRPRIAPLEALSLLK